MHTATIDTQNVVAEIARARTSAGLSDADLGRAARMSRWTVARLIRGVRPPSIVELAALGAAVGLDVRVRAYLAGDPIRDAGQQRLVDRFRAELHPSIAIRTEVPLPIEGDRRAWDAVITGAGWRAGVEAETVLDDLQALERRLELKVRDGGLDRVILVAASTPRNRRALASAPNALGRLGRESRSTLRALRRGEPPRSAILLI